jgi:hypothetical protein
MLASSVPDLCSSECRFGAAEVAASGGEDERRRLNSERLRAGGDVVVGGGEVVLWLEKRPEERVCTGAGSGEGSRRDPKRGIVVVGGRVGLVEGWM